MRNKVKNIWRTLLCAGLVCSMSAWSVHPVPASEEPAADLESTWRSEAEPESGLVPGTDTAPESAAVQEAGTGTDPGQAGEEVSRDEEIPEEETVLEEELPAEDTEAVEESDGEESADDGEEAEEEELEEDSMTGEEVAGAIHEIIEASSQMIYADREGIGRLQEYIDETQEAFGRLTAEEQEILSGSLENLSHAAAAVDVMQESMDQLESTGTILLAENGKENSWRFIDGVPIKDALEEVEDEAAEVAEVSPDETLLTSYTKENTKKPTGEFLSLTSAAGEQGRVILVGDDEVKKGIDVSKWQGIIDWETVKNNGIRFAIIRCGYGSDYVSQDDEMWYRNVQACEELGIPYGVYLYSHATNDAMVDSEVAHTLRLLQGHTPQLPVYLDIEENSQFLLGDAKLSKLADRYCSKIIAAGYRSGVYSSTYYWNNYLSLFAKNDNYYHWVAQWNPNGCSYGGRYEMWQYGIEQNVPGVGEVDSNLWYGAFPAAGSTKPPVKPVTDTQPHIGYKSHVQSFGWEGSWIKDGAMSGTEGKAKRLEGIQIQITGDDNLGVEYRTHVQTYGWENSWKTDGNTSGTVGESKRLEAIQIRLTKSDAEKYDVWYCVHAQHYGWLNWAKNGESAGTAGYGYRLEAIRIKLVKKGEAAPARLGTVTTAFLQPMIRYNTHVQTFGWQDWQYDGAMAGTTGLSKRLEGIHIQLTGQPFSGDIEYCTHVQTYGWEKTWRKNGGMSGTSGEAKRLEAIRIRLTGEMEKKYDVYYQTHIQNFGWTGWAKNGANCGSAGYAYRLEGIRIMLVSKGSAAPGSTGNTFYQK